MTFTPKHPAPPENHLAGRSGWLRAAVLGADDGLVSVSSIIVGVATSKTSVALLVAAGLAGLVADAMSMAAGEYVSVNTQRDVQQADRTREQYELTQDPVRELRDGRAYIELAASPRN